MGPGSNFGEQSLVYQSITSKTAVKCEEKTVLACLDRKSFERCLKRVEQRVVNEKISFFQEVECLQKFNRKQL